MVRVDEEQHHPDQYAANHRDVERLKHLRLFEASDSAFGVYGLLGSAFIDTPERAIACAPAWSCRTGRIRLTLDSENDFGFKEAL